MGRDSDYDGLLKVADAAMSKSAARMKDFTTGNIGVDLALGFTPVMSAYDTAKGFWNGTDDLAHGRYRAALRNYGSGVLNAGLTALDALTLGIGGKLVRGATKAIGRGGKAIAMARAARNAKRTGQALGSTRAAAQAAKGSGLYRLSNRIQRAGDAYRNADVAGQLAIANRLGGKGAKTLYSMKNVPGMTVDPRAAYALTSGGKGMARVGGWVARHPFWTVGIGGQASSMLATDPQQQGGGQDGYDVYRRAPNVMAAGAYDRFGRNGVRSMGGYVY